MSPYSLLEVRVAGDFACFTRPEHKVERVSYPLITPSAARGVLEAIMWKPEMRWRVRAIHVLKPIRYFNLTRNEVKSRQSEVIARRWREQGVGGYDVTADHTQRHTLLLRDVAYRIRAEIELAPDATADVAKYRDQFRRRVAQGRCFATPYLGCREFSAAFGPVDPDEQPIKHSEELGLMLLDLHYNPDGTGTPHFFPAQLNSGVLHVPDLPAKEVCCAAPKTT